jgi:hypothetical protein
MQPGEIYLAQFPVDDTPALKLRPVLLLTGPIGLMPEVLVAYISSIIPSPSLPSDILLDPTQAPFRATNLKVKSMLRLHKSATLHLASLARQLGEIDPPTLNLVLTKLRDLLKR